MTGSPLDGMKGGSFGAPPIPDVETDVSSGIDSTNRPKSFGQQRYSEDFMRVWASWWESHDGSTIDVGVLEEERPRLHSKLVSHPRKHLYHAEAALRTVRDESHIGGENPVSVTVTGHDETLRVVDLRERHVNQLVSIDAKVTDISSPHRLMWRADFDGSCPHSRSVWQTRFGDVDEPGPCPEPTDEGNECGCTSWYHEDSKYIDHQEVILQDLHGESDSPTPTDIPGGVTEDLVDEMSAGESVRVTAIVLADESGQGVDSQFALQIVGVEHEEEDFEALEITSEEEERIRELANCDDIHELVRDSIAPSLYGDQYDLPRSAVAHQLFGGVEREVNDSTKRGTIHVNFTGEPSTGKSQFARFARKVAPSSEFVSGESVSSVGLTAAVTREDRFNTDKWTLSGGVVVRANKGLAVIDEFDKAHLDAQKAMHEPLSDQIVSVAKSNVEATLEAKTSVLTVANPEQHRFDDEQPVRAQIGFQDALFSRFDLVCIFRDDAGGDNDEQKAAQILAGYADGGNDEDVIEPDLLTKYIAHARRTVDPVLDEEAQKYLSRKWSELRDEGNSEHVPILTRDLDAMARLATASARMRLSETATIEDARRAFNLKLESLQQVAQDEYGNLDADLAETGVSRSQRERVQAIWDAFETLASDDGSATHEALLAYLDDEGVDVDKVEADIENLLQKKDGLYEPEGGIYRKA